MKPKGTPIFRRILFPLMLLVSVQIGIILAIFIGTSLPQKITQYSRDITDSKLETQKNHLESMMVHNWMNLGRTIGEVNQVVQRMMEDGTITLQTLDQPGGASNRLLAAVSPSLIAMMRTNQVSGAFLILNTEPLEEELKDKPGVYFRDIDPRTAYSEHNTDLLIERSPASVIRATGITTDINWSSCFRFGTGLIPYYRFFKIPFNMALKHPELSWQNLGYWGSPYQLAGEDRYAITYSAPLRLQDGTVYGVLGIDITLRYLEDLLPFEELTEMEEDGSYFFARATKDDPAAFSHVYGIGPASWNPLLRPVRFNWENRNAFLQDNQEALLKIDTNTFYFHALPLGIYPSNVPYEDTHWVLGAVVPLSAITTYSRLIITLFLLAAVAVFIFGIAGALLVAFRIRKPVAQLESQLEVASGRRPVALQKTGIREIDKLSDEIERLHKEMLDSGKRFSRIIQMASLDMAGFQIDAQHSSLFISEGFYALFGLETPADPDLVTLEEFEQTLLHISSLKVVGEDANGKIHEIVRDGKTRYVQLRLTEEHQERYGLAEDVTQRLLRNRILLFERDHDALTGLYNRKAFLIRFNEFLSNHRPEETCGALLMVDLDNLKLINDRYGHERGDAAIKMVSSTMTRTLSPASLICRISGDEFNIFLSGKDRQEVDKEIHKLQEAFSHAVISVKDGQQRRVHISTGISWWPEDATTYDALQQYADMALYEAKRCRKGLFVTFDRTRFRAEVAFSRRREALETLLEHRRYHYEFQPIVDVKSGAVFGYEALMRPDMEEFESPLDVISVLRQEGRLHEFENSSIPYAVKTFFATQMEENSCLFFNSITNQILDTRSIGQIRTACHNQIERLVMEISELDSIEQSSWEEKVKWLRDGGGRLALDDYGTGYNNEKTLLRVHPDFVKVDIAIVKDIDKNADKQQIMAYIVTYAHDRKKRIIAEGVETPEEAKACISYGADYLQGFLFSRAQKVPSPIDKRLSEMVKAFARG